MIVLYVVYNKRTKLSKTEQNIIDKLAEKRLKLSMGFLTRDMTILYCLPTAAYVDQ